MHDEAGVEIFDSVARLLLDEESVSEGLKFDVLYTLYEVLSDNGMELTEASVFFDHPLVKEILGDS